MKSFILILFITLTSLSSYGQLNDNSSGLSGDKSNLLIGFGVNAINSLGSRNPFYKPSDWSYKNGFGLSIEQPLKGNLAISGNLSYILIEEGNRLDANSMMGSVDYTAPEDFNYFALDVELKYYFERHLFPNLRQLELFGMSGFGMFGLEDTNISLNIGGGALVWLNKNRTVGLKAQLTGKIALLEYDDNSFDNNHYLYALQAIIRL